jgi:hypothetical protein
MHVQWGSGLLDRGTVFPNAGGIVTVLDSSGKTVVKSSYLSGSDFTKLNNMIQQSKNTNGWPLLEADVTCDPNITLSAGTYQVKVVVQYFDAASVLQTSTEGPALLTIL